ncbi:hypothetical protein RvY_06472, partial [Ramazzottius varieornatus]
LTFGQARDADLAYSGRAKRGPFKSTETSMAISLFELSDIVTSVLKTSAQLDPSSRSFYSQNLC